MGWTPQQVRALSLSDFEAAFDGWMAAHCPQPDGPDYSPEQVARLDAIVEEERVKAWLRKW